MVFGFWANLVKGATSTFFQFKKVSLRYSRNLIDCTKELIQRERFPALLAGASSQKNRFARTGKLGAVGTFKISVKRGLVLGHANRDFNEPFTFTFNFQPTVDCM